MNSKKIFQEIYSQLLEFESEAEAESLTFWLLESAAGISRTDVLIEREKQLSPEEAKAIHLAVERLKKHEPIQHILGKIDFYNRKFLVNKNVLIPRPETEELVDLILKNHYNLADKTVVDIGTGSGIIAITIAKERKDSKVFGLDISAPALETAKRNALLNRADVTFSEMNILEETPMIELADIWVSNPPYVLETEKALMAKKVLDFDPSQALFVPDEKPMLFYDRISSLAREKLKPGGFLYFEINERYGNEVGQIMETAGFENVKVLQDMQNKDRFVVGQNKV